jgi:hypothetical protein
VFADARYFGTIPLLISLPLSFFNFRCVLVLLKLASQASCSSTGSNRDSLPTSRLERSRPAADASREVTQQ